MAKADKQHKKRVRLADLDPKDTGAFKHKQEAAAERDKLLEELEQWQEKLASNKQRAVLFLFQGMDCSGKDGVIHKVFAGLHPQGITTHSFKAPTEEEAGHDFLWRSHRVVPGPGQIGVFNRSYYEDVLITRVHGLIDDKEAERRFKQINQFEELLIGSGISIVKIFLHISKEFQREKLVSRIENPDKNWKFDPSDLKERKSWDKYIACYEDVFDKCSKAAPWHIVPADHRWYRNYEVQRIAVEALRAMKLPDPPARPDLARLLDELTGEAE